MTRRKSTGEEKAEAASVPVTNESAGWSPPVAVGKKAPGPRPCGQPEVPKTDDIGVKGEGGEFIKRGGKLYRS